MPCYPLGFVRRPQSKHSVQQGLAETPPTAALLPGKKRLASLFKARILQGFHVRERGLSRGLDVWPGLFGTSIVL